MVLMKNGLEELGNYIETKIHLVNDFTKIQTGIVRKFPAGTLQL